MDELVPTLACTEDGVFIWPGVALVERRGASFVRASDRDICNRAAALHGPEIIGSALIPTLERAARFLERGEIGKARLCLDQLRLPPMLISAEKCFCDRCENGSTIAQKSFDADKHPRWPAGAPDSTGGQFRPADADSSGASSVVADQLSDCIEKCYKLLERPLPSPGSDRNTFDFHRCVNNCRGRYL